jgi:tryptophan 7-halogenase
MSASEPIRSVVIVGNGVDGWTTAAALAQAFQGQQLEIQVLDQAPEALPVAEPAAPVCHAFHQHLGVDEAALMRECGGTFSLGMQFKHWVRDGHEYIEPMGPHGASIEYVHFHNFACKARQAGDATPFNDYSLCAVAARNGRFTHPSQDRSSILSTLFYVQHLDSDRYAAMMRTMALRLGALTIDGHLDGVERDGRGFVRSVRLSDGREIEGDLFIDCSGPAAWTPALPTGAHCCLPTASYPPAARPER